MQTSLGDALLILRDWTDRRCALLVHIGNPRFTLAVPCVASILDIESKILNLPQPNSETIIAAIQLDKVPIFYNNPLMEKSSAERAMLETMVKQGLTFVFSDSLRVTITETPEGAPPIFERRS